MFGRIFCDIWAAVDVLCCTASIMSLCVISIDRYIGVRYPLQYPMIVTEKRALLAMLGVWVLAIIISIGPLLGWKQPPSQVRNQSSSSLKNTSQSKAPEQLPNRPCAVGSKVDSELSISDQVFGFQVTLWSCFCL